MATISRRSFGSNVFEFVQKTRKKQLRFCCHIIGKTEVFSFPALGCSFVYPTQMKGSQLYGAVIGYMWII